METAVDTQMNGHIANGDVTHEERTESHVTTTSTTEVTTSSGFSSESRTITSEQHTMSEEHSEYREETQAAPGSAAMSCTRGSVSSESQDNPTPSVSISPPTSERQSATESGYDDMMGDFGEGLAPKADMDSELDLTPAVTPQDRSRDHEVPNGSHTAEDCSDIEMEEKAGGGSPQAGAEGSSDEEETRTFIEKDLSVPDHLEDMVMTAEESPLQEDKNSNNNPIVMEQAAEETKKEVENEDPDEKDIDDREDSVIEVESVTIDLDGKDRDGNEIKQMCDEADDGEVSNVASSGSGDRHEMEPRGAHAHPDSSSDEEHIPEKDVSKVTLASRVLEAERDGYISSEDERMIDHDEHDDGEQNTKLKATGGTEANPNQEIEVQSDDSEAEQPVPASSGTHASSSKQEAGYISSEEERSVEHYEHDDKVEEQATHGHVTHVRNPSSDVPEASGGAPQESQASEEPSEGGDVYEQGYRHGYQDETYEEQQYEREGSPTSHELSYEREGSPNFADRSFEREGSPTGHDTSYDREGSAEEHDAIPQKANYDSSNDSFGSHEPQSWHEHQVATSPPQSLRIEDTLADFQPSKRYVKPEEKQNSKAPGLMIMEASMKDGEPPIHDREPPSEYEIKPSQPFGSLVSKYADKGAMGDMMCQQCGKRVYEMEKIIADTCIYHKMCFKCQHCKRVLSLGNFASIDKQLYCKPHFIEIFKTRGNYDEGFGVERKVYQRSSKELIPAEENNLQSSTEEEPKDIARAEEKVDEGLGNLPSIKSIKNRFETPEPQAPPAPAGNRSRKSSDRSVDSSSVNGDARGYRKSKWDRPKGPPPPPINRATEAEGELANSEEVTSSESTKLLVSRFREIERGDHTTYQSERKPVHKITPPRDELARGIEEAERIYQEEQTTVESGSQRQEDMPPPSITKNKLAIFRSMEEDNQAAPSPARSSYTSSSVTRTQHSVTTHSHIKASPDSGISDSEQQGTGHRSDDDLDGDVMSRSDVIRAEDKAEEDLPGQGFTKSLLAQWKQKEIQSTYSRDSSPHSTSSQQTWNSNRRVETTHRRPAKKVVQTPDSDISSADEHAYENIPPRAGGMNGDMEESEYSGSVREVIRESDRNEDDELPPPSFTKNMLAKFQSMQEEATRDTYVRPPVKKQFKWTVKETKPLHTVTTTTTKREHRTTRTYSNNSESAEYHEYEEHEGPLADTLQDEEEYSEAVQADFRADEVLEEDLPPASFTRNMLAKFRSMEDVDQEPPTPEFSSKKMKAAIISVSPSHVRRFEGGPAPVYPDGELADEVEHMDNHHQYDFDYNAAIDAGEYENDPYSNPDVIREGDVLTEDLPEQGTTRHLLAKFQSMQAS